MDVQPIHGRKILREDGDVWMWQEFVAGPHRAHVLRYFVGRSEENAAAFSAPYLAFEHFRKLTAPRHLPIHRPGRPSDAILVPGGSQPGSRRPPHGERPDAWSIRAGNDRLDTTWRDAPNASAALRQSMPGPAPSHSPNVWNRLLSECKQSSRRDEPAAESCQNATWAPSAGVTRQVCAES
jgi:hypothetical protein